MNHTLRNPFPTRSAFCATVLCLAALAGIPAARAQDSADPAPADQDATDDAEQRRIIREQTIYVPYDKLEKTFEREGRGVFLPYEQFRQLWDAARLAVEPEPDKQPPAGSLITEIDSQANVEADIVRVTALLKFEVLAGGWNEIPLRLADAAITSATLDGQPARIVVDGEAGYKLLLEKEGDQPQQFELTLEYVKTIDRAPGRNSVSFQAPQSPVNRWRVRIPESGVKVDLDPMIAATEVTGQETPDGEVPAEEPAAQQPQETVVLAFMGAAPSVRIAWTPKAEGATGLEALASVQAEQRVLVHEGVIRTHTQLDYTISRAELGLLRIEVPADHKVVNVFDANVRQWSVEPAGDAQTISVQLFEPAKGSQRVIVELEKFTDAAGGEVASAAAPAEGEEPADPASAAAPAEGEEPADPAAADPANDAAGPAAGTLEAPLVRALDVGRQQGVLVVQVDQELAAEVTGSTGLIQVDAGDLPPSLAGGDWAFSYRYATVPFGLALEITKIQPRILADSLVEAELRPEALVIETFTVYTIERAGVFRLELDVPAGFEVAEVYGRDAAGATAVQVDTHHLEGPDQTRLIVHLSRKAFGRVALVVRLEQDLDDVNLKEPTDEAAQIVLPLPGVAPETVQRTSGRLMVYSPESLRVNPADAAGLRSISFPEALEGMAPSPSVRSSDSRAVLAFAFGREAAELTLEAQRRKPQVTIRQLTSVRIDEGVVKFRAAMFYEILYSGVESLFVDVPTEMASTLRVDTKTIRHKVVDPPPEDLTPGCVRWSLSGETELLGEGFGDLSWERKLDDLEVAQTVEIVVPRLVPVGVDRAWGQIVLGKAETIDVRVSDDSQGLRPIDPNHDLMPGADRVIDDRASAAQAFEFHDDWNLSIAATRYEVEEIKHTSIERAVIRAVVTRAEKTTMQALFQIRSARQRLVIEMPDDVTFGDDPRINGRRVALEAGENNQYYIPLTGRGSEDAPGDDESFLLELRFTLPGTEIRHYPVFPLEPAVQEVFLCVYLPEEIDLLDTDGPWTKRFTRGVNREGEFRPLNDPDQEELLNWVCEGVSDAENFPIDGRLYVFSTLRPDPPDKARLRLVTAEEDWVNGCLIFVVLAIGLVLLFAKAGLRILGVGSVVIVVLILGVRYPLLVWQMSDVVLLAAVGGVLALWTIKFLGWTAPRMVREARNACCAAAGAEPTEPAKPPELPESDEVYVVDDKTDRNEGGENDA